MKHICKKSLSFLLVLCMIASLFAGLSITASAAATETVTVKVVDSASAEWKLATWTYDSTNRTYIDGNTKTELAIVSDYSSAPLVYTGINKKTDPRCLSVTTKGIELENLYDYAEALLGVPANTLRGDTAMTLAAGSFKDTFTYNQYWGLTRYNYMSWYNAADYTTAKADDFDDGVVVPATLAICGYHSALNGGTQTTAAALAAQADDSNALRISLGMQANGSTAITGTTTTDINEGNLSVKNIDTITFTLNKTFAELNTVTVSTAAELAAIAAAVNAGTSNYEGKTVVLANAIDLSSCADWTPIGDATHAFAGTFNGAGYAIIGLKIANCAGGYHGLFGNNSGTVKDFSVSGTIGTDEVKITSGTDNIGGVVGYNSGTVSGVTGNVSIYVNSSGIYAVGGIVGQNGGTIEDCWNQAPVTGTKATGGICGRSYASADGAAVIRGCVNTGTVTGNGGGKDQIGGIVGGSGDKNNTGMSYNTITNCRNAGAVSNPSGRWTSGIAGFATKLCKITNCCNTGTIANPYSKNGGLIAYMDSGSLADSSGNYALAQEGYTGSSLNGTSKTAAEMMAPAMITALNGENGTAWKFVCGSDPVLSWETKEAFHSFNGKGICTRCSAVQVTSTIVVKLDGVAKKTYSASALSMLAAAHSGTLYFSGIGGGQRTINDSRTLAAAKSYVTVEELLQGAINSYTDAAYADYDIVFTASDNHTTTMTVADLLGTARYYYPAWLTAAAYTDVITGEVANNAAEVPAVLALCGYTATSDDNGLNSESATYGCFAAPSMLDAVCDTTKAPRLLLGQKSGGDSTEKNLGGLSGTNIVSIELKAPVAHSITKADTVHGSFTVSPTKSIKGKTVTVTTAPAQGYTVGSVLAGTTAATMTAENTYTFTMPDADVTVTVTFANSSYIPAGADTTWYNTTDSTFTLNDAADLLGFAAIVNNEAAGIAQDSFAGKTVTLGADIPLSGVAWTPIGGSVYQFSGTFDGANKKITDLSVSSTTSYAGLFGYNKGTIKKLTLSGAVTATGAVDYIGSVAGYNGGTITGVTSEVTVTAESAYNVGGLAGFNDGGKNANISATETTGNNAFITKSAFTGSVTGNTKVGGIAGENSGIVRYCYSSATVDGTNYDSKNGVGGIVGRNGNNNTAYEEGLVDSCYFTGSVGCDGQKWVGGIAGFNNDLSTVKNCFMAGSFRNGANKSNAITNPDTDTAAAKCTNNYALAGYTNSGNTEAENGIAKTSLEMKSSALITLLNGESGTAWVSGCTHPALFWETVSHSYVSGVCTECGTVDPNYTPDTPQIPVAPTSATWDGESVDVSWYFSNPDASSYTISSAAEFAGAAALVNGLVNESCTVYTDKRSYSAAQWNASAYVRNASGTSGTNNRSTDDYSYGVTNFSGVTITLCSDLDMSAGNYMPIGGQYLMTDENTSTKIDASFCGVLDGGGHNVSVSCDRHCSGNYGDGQSVGIVGRLGLHDNEAAQASSLSAIGVKNLAVYGSVKGNRSVGGVVGKIGKNNGAVIESCANFATVTGTDAKGTGGIVGAGWNGGTIKNCYNAGTITNTGKSEAAGISGSNESDILNCYNRGKITGPSGSSTAAIASAKGNESYTNCYWLDTSASIGVYNKTLASVVSKTAAELKAFETVTALGSAFAADSANVNGGYPVLAWQAGSSGGSSEKKTDTVVEAKTTVSNGTASVSVTDAAVKSSVTAAKDSGKSEIVIKADTNGKIVSTTNVTIPAAAVKTVSDNGLGVSMAAANGSSLTLDSGAFKSAASQAGSAELKVEVKTETVKEAAKALESAGIGAADAVNATIVSIDITAGAKAITSFDGTLTLRLPAPSGLKVGDTNVIYQVSGDGKVEKHVAAVKLVNGVLVSEITTTHLSTFLVTKEQGLPFTDVKNHWAYDAIAYVYGNKLFSGVSDTKFDPDGSMTRAMLVTVLYRMEGEPTVSGSNPFQDVAAGKWYTDAVVWAKANGIVDGYDATHFGTDDSVTREQIAVILMRYAAKKGCDVSKENALTAYTDANQISTWALSAIQWANAENLITGRTAATIAPKGTATRAEVASILMRYQQNIAN